jgi:hypothetical protein
MEFLAEVAPRGCQVAMVAPASPGSPAGSRIGGQGFPMSSLPVVVAVCESVILKVLIFI